MAQGAARLAIIPLLILLLLSGSGLSQNPKDDLPELHLTALYLDPSPVELGRSVKVSVKLENSGNTPADEFKVEFFVRVRPKGGEIPSWTSFDLTELRGLSPKDQEVEINGFLDTSDPTFIPAPDIYEIRVVVDSNDQIPEMDETNNELSISLLVIPSKLGKPDLRPVALTFQSQPSPDKQPHSSPFEQGETVVVKAKIANTGDRDAGPFLVGFSYCRVAEGLAFCPAEEFISFPEGPLPVSGGLPQGSTLDLSSQLLTAELEPGSYLIKVLVDPPGPDNNLSGQVEEQDEANNELIAALSIEGPELQPTGLSFDPVLPRAGDEVNVTVTVLNSGRGTARDFEIAFFIDGTQFALQTLTLEEGQEAAATGKLKTLELNLEVGIHLIQVVIDPFNKISERDETNNEIRTALTLQTPIPRRPELHPKTLVINPSSPIELDVNSSLTIRSEVRNTGDVAAHNFEIAFSYRSVGSVRWIPLPCTTNCTVAELPRNASITAQGELILAGLAPGNYEVQVEVDPDDRVEELDPYNNVMRSSFTLLAPRKPDLFLDPLKVQIMPSLQVSRGTSVMVTAEILNIGERAAGPFSVEFSQRRIDEEAFTVFSTERFDGLGIGRRAEAEAVLETAPLRPGYYEIRIVARLTDPSERELDETNNSYSTGANPESAQPLFIEGPNLTVLLRFADPSALEPPTIIGQPLSVSRGEEVELVADISNIGHEAAGSFEVTLCRRKSDEAVCVSFGEPEPLSFPGMGAGVSRSVRVSLDTGLLEPGTYVIGATVDPVAPGQPYGRVEEENEWDNQAFLELGVLPQANLKIAKITLDPPSPTVGESVTIFADILNDGEGPARKPFTVEFALRRLSQAAEEGVEPECVPFATVEISGLAPGEQAVVKAELQLIDVTLQDEICVTVDPEDVIPEQNEEDNRLIVPLGAVPEPEEMAADLTVLGLTLAPEEADWPADRVQVTAEIANIGRADAGPFQVSFFYKRAESSDNPKFFSTRRVAGGLSRDARVLITVELLTALLPSPGVFEIIAVADYNDEVTELSEDNNTLSKQLKAN